MNSQPKCELGHKSLPFFPFSPPFLSLSLSLSLPLPSAAAASFWCRFSVARARDNICQPSGCSSTCLLILRLSQASQPASHCLLLFMFSQPLAPNGAQWSAKWKRAKCKLQCAQCFSTADCVRQTLARRCSSAATSAPNTTVASHKYIHTQQQSHAKRRTRYKAYTNTFAPTLLSMPSPTGSPLLLPLPFHLPLSLLLCLSVFPPLCLPCSPMV